MSYLKRLPKVSGEELRRLVAARVAEIEAAEREARAKAKQQEKQRQEKRHTANGREFRILEHITTRLRKAGRNYVTQCPSCAAAGCDHAGDNLAVQIEDPRLYQCWAGCTREMIREALGCPIRYRQSA